MTKNNHAARPGDILDAYLALSRIYFASTERLSDLALETARSAVEDCVAAARLAAVKEGAPGLQAWQSIFGEPAIARARNYTRGSYEILVGAQSEAAQLLGGHLTLPAMQFPLADDLMSAFGRFSKDVRELAVASAANVAAVGNVAADLPVRKAA